MKSPYIYEDVQHLVEYLQGLYRIAESSSNPELKAYSKYRQKVFMGAYLSNGNFVPQRREVLFQDIRVLIDETNDIFSILETENSTLTQEDSKAVMNIRREVHKRYHLFS